MTNRVLEEFARVGAIADRTARIAEWRRLIASVPAHFPSWFNLATDLHASGDVLRARRAALEGFRIVPERRATDRGTTAGGLVRIGEYDLESELQCNEMQVLYRATDGGTPVMLRKWNAGDDLDRLYGEHEIKTRRRPVPHLVRALGTVEAEDGLYQVLDDVPGTTLANLIAVNQIEIDVAVDIVTAVGQALAKVREAKVPIVELRPEVIVRANDLERGIVFLGPLAGASVPPWNAPEEAQAADERSLTYRLGLLLYAAATRRPIPTLALTGERAIDLSGASAWGPRWSALPDLILRAVSKDPDRRPELGAWIRDLDAARADRASPAPATVRGMGGLRMCERLGQGQFGVVYRAETPDGESRAVKVLFRHFAADGETVMRFRNEGEIAARLAVPGIVGSYGGGTSNDDEPYLVMEYMRGGSLEERLQGEPLAAGVTVEIGLRVAEAMAAAHAGGILHRDLKPSNLLLGSDDVTDVHVGDFGIAKLLGEPTEVGIPFTRTGRLLGSPQYMAPEQWRMEELDGRVDVYALGVILHRCLSGALPFTGRSEYQLQQAHLGATPPALARGVPGRLAALVGKMLAKERDDRPASMQEVAAELRAIQAAALELPTVVKDAATPPPEPPAKVAAPAKPAPPSLPDISFDVEECVRAETRGLFTNVYLEGAHGAGLPKWRAAAEANVADGHWLVGECHAHGLGGPKDEAQAVAAWRRAADAGHAPSEHAMGMAYLAGFGVAADLTQAAAWLTRAAAQKYAAAENQLGMLFLDGQGVAVDRNEAARLFKRAAEAGNRLGQYNLAACYLNGRGVVTDEAAALRWARKAAEAGEPKAQHGLGVMLASGLGTAVDKREAARWFRAAADQGYTDAEYDLADCYKKGAGVAADPAEAVRLYRRAADKGHAMAQAMLGMCLSQGTGTRADPVEGVAWYRKAAEQGFAGAQFALAAAYDKGVGVARDEREYVRWLRAAAEQGLGIAQEQLAECYRDGRGVISSDREHVAWSLKAAAQGRLRPQIWLSKAYRDGVGVATDEGEAMRWCKAAAEQGSPTAQRQMGSWCEQGYAGTARDQAEAIRWWRLAADQGDDDAQFELGVCYRDGHGVARDLKEAARWFKLSAEQGNYLAQACFGAALWTGAGVAQDRAAATTWYRKAAEQGLAVAQFNLASAYENGDGVARDLAEAARWYRKAAPQHAASANNLANLLHLGADGVPADLPEAVRLYRLAAEQGVAPAQTSLAGMYEQGEGVAKDEAQAVQWYRRAAEQDDVTAQNNLGICYYAGRGVTRDYREAMRWFERAAAQGSLNSLYSLGLLHLFALGVPKDVARARTFFQQAADGGHEGAAKELAALRRS